MIDLASNPAGLTSSSAQSYIDDPRNDDVLVYVNGEFVHRDKAVVSVFDGGFVLGDGVWEGLRLINGRLLAEREHMDRLFEGAGAISLDIGMTRQQVVDAVVFGKLYVDITIVLPGCYRVF